MTGSSDETRSLQQLNVLEPICLCAGRESAVETMQEKCPARLYGNVAPSSWSSWRSTAAPVGYIGHSGDAALGHTNHRPCVTSC